MTERMARREMHGMSAQGDGPPCCVCGLPTLPDATPLGKVVSDNFTTWDKVDGNRASPVCAGCVGLFGDFQFRSTALFAQAGTAAKMDGPYFLDLLLNPPALPFAVTFPASRKKHCWLNAGLSSDDRLLIGCDDNTVSLSRQDALRGVELIVMLFDAGATKTEVKAGFYRPVVAQRLGAQLEIFEIELRPMRAIGALDILTWAVPREKGAGSGDVVMLTGDDRRAAELLARLANGSSRRDGDAIGFWGTSYLARVQRRISSRSLMHFVEALSADIGVRTTNLRATVEWLDAMPEDERATILPAIKASPRIMVAMAQDSAKKLRPGAARHIPDRAPADTSGAEDALDDATDDLFWS